MSGRDRGLDAVSGGRASVRLVERISAGAVLVALAIVAVSLGATEHVFDLWCCGTISW